MRLLKRGIVALAFGLIVLVLSAALMRGFGQDGATLLGGIIFFLCVGAGYWFWTKKIDPWLDKE